MKGITTQTKSLLHTRYCYLPEKEIPRFQTLQMKEDECRVDTQQGHLSVSYQPKKKSTDNKPAERNSNDINCILKFCIYSRDISPYLLLGAQDQRLGAKKDQFPCWSTGKSVGNCQERKTCMVRACHTPRQPFQNRPSGHLGGWSTP